MFLKNLMQKKLLVKIIGSLLFVFIASSVSCDFGKKVEVIIDIETALEPDEPGRATVIIDNEKREYLNEYGRIFLSVKKKVDDILKIRFEKEGYYALDAIVYKIKPEGNYIKRRISFRKKVLPKTPEPGPIKTVVMTADFITRPKLAGVNIYLNDEKIGITNSAGIYHWETEAPADEKGQLLFRVEHSVFDLVTTPQKLVIKKGADVKKRFIIVPHVRKTPFVKVKVLNNVDQTPLENVKLRFSDSDKSVITNKNGIAEYKIRETTYKKEVNLKITEPQDLVIVDGFKPINITNDMPDNIDIVLRCKATFIIKIAFENLSGEKLADVRVSVQGGKTYKSDKNGRVKIPVNRLHKKYILKISKIKYQDITKEVIPDKPINDYGVIRLRGVTGIVIVEDSLSKRPVPFVNVFERGKNIGQTGSNGRVTVGVLLNMPMKLKFVPADPGTYQEMTRTLIFKSSGEVKRIRMKPQPYNFKFHFVSAAGGGPVEGVEVKYKMLRKLSDSNGSVQINTYDITKKDGSVDNSFKIAYKSYQTEYRCNIKPQKRVYQLPDIYIPTKVNITIKTVPPGGELKVFDNQGNIVIQGREPLTGAVLPDLYRVEGQYGGTVANRQYMISDDSVIVFSIFNPIDLIIQKYEQGAYNQVVEIFEDPDNQDRIRRQDENYCKALDYVFKAYAQLNGDENKAKAVEIGERLINERCVTNDPYFLFNLAGRYKELGKWEKADEYYEKAHNGRIFVQTADRLQFVADCLYFRVDVRVERILSPGAFSDNTAKCLYLETTKNLWDEFIQLANNRGLDFKQADYLKQKIDEGMRDAKCP